MKILRKIVFISIIAVALFLICAYVFVNQRGAKLLKERLGAALQREVTLSSTGFAFPFGVTVNDFSIERLFTAKRISAQLGLKTLFTGDLHIADVSIVSPSIEVYRNKKGQFFIGEQPPTEVEPETEQEFSEGSDLSVVAGDSTETSVQPVESKQSLEVSGNSSKNAAEGTEKALAPSAPLHSANAENGGRDSAKNGVKLSIGKIIIKNGLLTFYNRSYKKDQFEFLLENINLSVRNISFPPKKGKLILSAKSSIKGRYAFSKSGRLTIKGWADIVNKNMDATVQIIDKDDRAGLKAAAVSKNNDLTVSGDVMIENLAFVTDEEKEREKEFSFKHMVIGALQSTGVLNGISMRFNFKTKMDDFRIERISFSGSIRQ